MRELTVILALLARAWALISRLYLRSTAVPADLIDEFQALNHDLTEFFRRPKDLFEPITEESVPVPAPVPATGAAATGAVICPSCSGSGSVGTPYLGVPATKCGACDGARMVKTLNGATVGRTIHEEFQVPAWGSDGANWYSKDQRYPPNGYWKAWVDLQTSGDQK